MDNAIVNWVINLYGEQCDLEECAALFASETEIHIEREQSGESTPRYYLHSSKFKGLPAAQIHTVAAELIAKVNAAPGGGSVTIGIPVAIRADGSRETLVTSASGTTIEIMANAVADAHTPTESLSALQKQETVHVEIVSYPQILLNLARSLMDEGRFSIAVVVVHMACEIATEQALSAAFATKDIQYLKDWIIRRLNGYNLANDRIRSLYTALTGDNVQQATFWQEFRTSSTLRNNIIHGGANAAKANAEASYEAGNALLAHLTK
jgi:hypothetical protein